ncbi:MAG: FtsQ-type POTRA domain-containing protein [Oscillospiraceae bacterium]|nr:FtsQ-type POTRA domain-containing protein [Oscillospiraceae bacterium]
MSAARKNRRRYKKRGRFGFLYKVLSVIALAAAVFMGATVFFRVENVEVTGNIRYDAAQVEQASGVSRGDNLFGLNKYDTAARIRRTLPYVESVNIRRRLPDTLILNLNECAAAAQFSNGEGGWLISASGKLLDWSDAPHCLRVVGMDPVLPEVGTALTVKPEYQTRADGMIALLQALQELDMLSRATRLDLSSITCIRMELDDRFTVKLPVSGDFSYLLAAMDKAIQSLEPFERGSLDLTVKDYTVVFSPA